YFYLHPDTDIGITEHSCAYLRLCFGLASDEHYDCLLNNRIVSLQEPFGNKLGWHMGWAYARVGTEDWTDHVTREGFGRMITKLLNEACGWIADAKIDEAMQAISNHPPAECGLPSSPDEMRRFIDTMPGRTPKYKLLESIREILKRTRVYDDRRIVNIACGRLMKDEDVQRLPNHEAYCRRIQDYLAEEGIFSDEIIIRRITELLNKHEEFSSMPGKDLVLSRLLNQPGDVGILDNDAFVNKLYNLIEGDPQFKSAVKELERLGSMDDYFQSLQRS
ncbi:MAG: hypothetical protein V2B18_13360, partial [Pseudomonadota bacterium]